MNETTLTITGNLVDDAELRFTPSGQPVAKFRIASTPEVLRQEGEKRTVYELEADEVGVSLRSASAKVTRASRASSGNGGERQAEADPWASDRTGSYSDEPPF